MADHTANELRTPKLLDIETWCIQQLIRGAADPKSAFHWPVLCTAGPVPHGRVVVFRKFLPEERQIILYTDARTQKVKDLEHQPVAECVFYDPRKSVQIRASGIVTVLTSGNDRDQHFQALRPDRRGDYSTQLAPGQPVDLIEQASVTDPDLAEQNFCLIRIQVTSIDWLKLDRSGHARARFYWRSDEVTRQWSVP